MIYPNIQNCLIPQTTEEFIGYFKYYNKRQNMLKLFIIIFGIIKYTAFTIAFRCLNEHIRNYPRGKHKDVRARVNTLKKRTYYPIALMYHNVGNKSRKGLTPISLLQMHIEYIKKKKWSIVSLDKYLEYHQGVRVFDKPAVLLTFDDGYAATYTHVFPLSKKYAFPFMVFMPVEQIGRDNAWNYRAQFQCLHLKESHIREMSAQGVDFGSHGMSHRNFFQLNYEERQRELSESKKILESLIQKEIFTFAYPYGYYRSSMFNEVKQTYKYAFGASYEDKKEKSVFALPRIDAEYLIGPKHLWLACMGREGIFQWLNDFAYRFSR